MTRASTCSTMRATMRFFSPRQFVTASYGISVVSTTASHHGAEKKVMIFRLEGVQADPLVTSLERGGHAVLSITT